MHTVRDQFSAPMFGLGNGSEWAWCAMEQGSHGIEAMGNMRDSEFYRFLRLFKGAMKAFERGIDDNRGKSGCASLP